MKYIRKLKLRPKPKPKTKPKKSIKRKIFFTFLLIFFAFFIIPFIGLSIYEVNRSVENEMEEKKKSLSDHVEKLQIQIQDKLQIYLSNFNLISKLDGISQIVQNRYENTTLDEIYQNASVEERIKGDIYTKELNNSQLYMRLQNQFYQFSLSGENIMMIRVFYTDGNVLTGIIKGEEDLTDYKGDKSWFQDTLSATNEETVFISPISIARMTLIPTIRFSKAIFINGSVEGVFIMSYNVNSIIFPIINSIYSNNSVNVFLDTNYEDAEGDQIGEVCIVKSDQPKDIINESTAGNIIFKVDMFSENLSSSIQLIEINGINYYHIYAKISFGERNWIILTADLIENFTLSSKNLQKNLVFFFISFILIISCIVIISTYYSAQYLGKIMKEKEELIKLFPICANCKKIRDSNGYWNKIEDYLHIHADLDFTHTLCLECSKKLYPDINLEE